MWMDKTLICPWCWSACHHHYHHPHPHHHQLLSLTLSIFPGRNEWILSGIVLVDLWRAALQMKLCSFTFLQLSNPSHRPALQMGNGTCVRAHTHRDVCTCMHEHTKTSISSRAWGQAGFAGVWILAFPQLGVCWTCSVHQTSIKVSVWVMRPGSQGDQTAALPASRPAWWPSVWAEKDQKHAWKKEEEKSRTNRKMKPSGKSTMTTIRCPEKLYI